jgi:hypothetical protein
MEDAGVTQLGGITPRHVREFYENEGHHPTSTVIWFHIASLLSLGRGSEPAAGFSV